MTRHCCFEDGSREEKCGQSAESKEMGTTVL